MQLECPILLITFIREDTTRVVFEEIRKAKPTKLYISSNHWRNNEEKEKILRIRNILQDSVDWNCELRFIIHSTHLCAKESISQAIDYFFKNEEMGIILEDDTVPNQSFFLFCKEMLKKYKDAQNIFMVSGWSALDFDLEAKNSLKEDYYFSKYSHIWGWASWRRAWKLYQKEFVDFEKEFALLEFDSREEKKTWHKIFKAYSQGKIDTWDYPWTYTIWKNRGLSIYPKNNMVKNIGFNREDATHTTEKSKYETMRQYEIALPILHQTKIKRDRFLDIVNFQIVFYQKSIFGRIVNKIIKILFKNKTAK